MNYTQILQNAFPRSTQIIDSNIEQSNKLAEHIKIKEKFPIAHSISIDYSQSGYESPTTQLKYTKTPHGFFQAIHQSYDYHQHLSLSPDDLWLTIAQGVSQHININAEQLRSHFVAHEGKKDLEIFVDPLDWPKAVNLLVAQVEKNVEKVDLVKTLVCDFSTSSEASITASRIVLLDAMKKYFTYTLRGGCGIPKVTLTGTLEDWQKLQEKVVRLRQLGLDMNFWLDRLEPVIWKFVATYRGEIDKEFWSKVMSTRGYASGELRRYEGWIAAFFPYDKKQNRLTTNYLAVDQVPEGRVNVPFKLKLIGKELAEDLNMSAGFLGARQESVWEGGEMEIVVSPIIGWFISPEPRKTSDSFRF
ncbi:hypothetical protein G9A89_002495 [Geosiphon pyriformis]|nr:hypothetical protein G9A89_002495 [Geosiphon pyriformis]